MSSEPCLITSYLRERKRDSYDLGCVRNNAIRDELRLVPAAWSEKGRGFSGPECPW